MSEDITLLRAVSNALWPHLRGQKWKTHTCTRDLSKHNPRGYQAGPRTATVPQAESMNATIELHHEKFITAVLYAEDWPGKTSHALRLDERGYDLALVLSFAYDLIRIADFEDALKNATCRQPFHAQANRHGQMRLRRNATDRYITPSVAKALERIASVTKVLPISEATIDDYLITDDDIDLAAVEKAVA